MLQCETGLETSSSWFHKTWITILNMVNVENEECFFVVDFFLFYYYYFFNSIIFFFEAMCLKKLYYLLFGNVHYFTEGW